MLQLYRDHEIINCCVLAAEAVPEQYLKELIISCMISILSLGDKLLGEEDNFIVESLVHTNARELLAFLHTEGTEKLKKAAEDMLLCL